MRDSDDIFEWHRPTSAKDAVELIYFNFICGCLIGCLWLGAGFFYGISKGIRTCCGFRKPHFTEEARVTRRRKKESPVPLPAKRRRALTIPLPVPPTGTNIPWQIKQKTFTQSHSDLVTKLPFEIRRSIIEYVIFGDEEGEVFHVFKKWRKLNYWQCHKTVDGLPCSWQVPCCQALSINMALSDNNNLSHPPYDFYKRHRAERCFNPKLVSEPRKFDGGVVSLLRTCRQIYSETIPVLYSAHFQFPNPADVFDFSRTILPERLDSIDSISMDWTIYTDFINDDAEYEMLLWQMAWDVLSRMKGLKELRIYSKITPATRELQKMDLTRDMIRKMKQLKVFELLVPASQLPLWDGFIEPGMGITLVSSPVGIVGNG